jgi:glycosyltransferase involved in cell wall biosynthesis
MTAAIRPDQDVTIVHLAVDYNTPHRPRTTTAVEWLVGELGEFDNVVIAMLRTTRLPVRAPIECPAVAARLFDVSFFGLPFGIGLHRAMRRAATGIIALLEREGIRPSLVHAHKFTFEGLAGWYVARHFGVPLFISLRGEVETKVFRAKPLLRPFLRSIARDAARLYFVSAWFEPMFAAFVPGQATKARRLPNIVRNISPTITIAPPDQGLVSVFNLDTNKRKGLAWLLDAMVIAVRAEPDCTLEIIGGGSPAAIERCAAMIAKRGLDASVRLVGALSNAELLQRLPHYRAMALPSLNETFGMVYVESLFAGIPVLYTAGTAVDGYLDGLGVAIAVPARDSAAIAAGLLELWRDARRFRQNIMRAGPALFATFDPVANVERYREDVRGVVNLG